LKKNGYVYNKKRNALIMLASY